ncbi:MAG: DUF896 domain-containing protein [Acidaminococcaceae bacterium]|nr:DUF896 domain-containing protein [Acidaminococcaceae bacterium]
MAGKIMDMQKIIIRINELAAKKRQEGLTDAETVEQKKLYRIYLDTVTGNLQKQLDNIEVVDKK